MALQPFIGPWPLFCFLIFYTVVGLFGWRISPLQGRYMHIQDSTQTFLPQVEFEPTISVFERAKTIEALDRVATVIGGGSGSLSILRCYGNRRLT
jgi:hypothetical protein